MTAGATISDESVLAALGRLSNAQLAPAMKVIKGRWLTRVLLGFDTGRSPYGDAWHPIVRKGQILRHKGTLENSLRAATSGEDFVQLGTNVEYAPRHQFGFVGLVHVKAHWRTIKQAFGKPIAPRSIKINPYDYIAVTTPRPFLPTGGLPAAWREDVLTTVSKMITTAVTGEK